MFIIGKVNKARTTTICYDYKCWNKSIQVNERGGEEEEEEEKQQQ